MWKKHKTNVDALTAVNVIHIPQFERENLLLMMGEPDFSEWQEGFEFLNSPEWRNKELRRSGFWWA